jgi:hypothetical protein
LKRHRPLGTIHSLFFFNFSFIRVRVSNLTY